MEAILEVETLDLGTDVRAISLELVEPGTTREPILGADAAAIWSRVLRSVAAGEPLAVDFFSHLARVREFCERHDVAWREGAGKNIVIQSPSDEALEEILERFETETFGARAGRLVTEGDPELEAELSRRGADAYQAVYSNYTFCAIFALEEASLTLLAPRLWGSEVVRRVRPTLEGLDVEVRQPV